MTIEPTVTKLTSLYFHYGYSKITQIDEGVKQNETKAISVIESFQIYETDRTIC
ncbi:hypothetical protein [Parageobacillus toebii]|uniref:hypothetical protein n=1 Tax=Parageobacillus toebii TaxID=153151 RepID=UPI00142FA788|nr:hypothetical protein [Parageobacillus toebii]QNU34351.1 hypothetical protein IC802_16430 [Geobacillus sp. 44C]